MGRVSNDPAAHERSRPPQRAAARSAGPREEIVEPEALSRLVSYRIRLIQIAAYKGFEAVTRGFGSVPRYFGLLSLVAANPGITQNRLARAIHLDRSSLVPILDMLEREGVVERRASERDRRVRRIHVTAKGAELLARLEPHVAAHEARMVAGLTASERDTLLALLKRVDTNMRVALARPPA